jgi:hypothetical protein
MKEKKVQKRNFGVALLHSKEKYFSPHDPKLPIFVSAGNQFLLMLFNHKREICGSMANPGAKLRRPGQQFFGIFLFFAFW